jgi:hypothetical protein
MAVSAVPARRSRVGASAVPEKPLVADSSTSGDLRRRRGDDPHAGRRRRLDDRHPARAGGRFGPSSAVQPRSSQRVRAASRRCLHSPPLTIGSRTAGPRSDAVGLGRVAEPVSVEHRGSTHRFPASNRQDSCRTASRRAPSTASTAHHRVRRRASRRAGRRSRQSPVLRSRVRRLPRRRRRTRRHRRIRVRPAGTPRRSRRAFAEGFATGVRETRVGLRLAGCVFVGFCTRTTSASQFRQKTWSLRGADESAGASSPASATLGHRPGESAFGCGLSLGQLRPRRRRRAGPRWTGHR